jgi:hypothetical protein
MHGHRFWLARASSERLTLHEFRKANGLTLTLHLIAPSFSFSYRGGGGSAHTKGGRRRSCSHEPPPDAHHPTHHTQCLALTLHLVTPSSPPSFSFSHHRGGSSAHTKGGCRHSHKPPPDAHHPTHCMKPAADLGSGPISVRREGEPARWPGRVLLRPDSDSSLVCEQLHRLVIDYHAGYDS